VKQRNLTADRRHNNGGGNVSGKEDRVADHAALVIVGVLAGVLIVECFGDILLAFFRAWVSK
jgi:hypothetical protein